MKKIVRNYGVFAAVDVTCVNMNLLLCWGAAAKEYFRRDDAKDNRQWSGWARTGQCGCGCNMYVDRDTFDLNGTVVKPPTRKGSMQRRRKR